MKTENKIQEENRILTGSSWMTLGSFASRILGAIYIILWMPLMGTPEEATTAHGLYQIAYNTYALFLAFSTAGVPSAISKQISYFNAREEYEISKNIYRQGLLLMLTTGVVSAAVLYFLAPSIVSGSTIADESAGITVMRSLVPALLIIPSQSVTRGLFQGHSRMREPAISQIIEQFARVIFILASAYLVRRVLAGEVVTAVAYSTFAAFVGALFSIMYLLFRLRKIPTALNRAPEESKNEISISTSKVIMDIIKTSIPFVIISSGLIVFQLIDQQTLAPLMKVFFPAVSAKSVEINYGIIQANAHKLSTIITSFGAALAITSVPVMSDLMAKKDYKEVAYQFEQAIQLLMFIMLPAIIGVFVVAGPFYTIFYTYNEYGVFATRLYAITSLFMGLYMVLGNILQAIDLRRLGIYTLGIGLLTKLITQPLFVRFFGEMGMLYSTIIGLLVTNLLMFKIMHEKVHFSVKFLARRTLLILILSIIMGLFTQIAYNFLGLFINFESRMFALIGMLITVGVGVGVYGYLILKTRLAEKIIGNKAADLRVKLRIK